MTKLIVNPEEIKEIFFDAILNGYARPSSEKKSIPHFPNSKVTRYRTDLWLVIDAWTTNPDTGHSFGSTCIYHKGTLPVWFMQYSGIYPKSLTWFLKEALKENYKNRRFTGGRGPFQFEPKDNPRLLYTNNVNCSGFIQFNGREDIKQNGILEGYHIYNGGLMIKP